MIGQGEPARVSFRRRLTRLFAIAIAIASGLSAGCGPSSQPIAISLASSPSASQPVVRDGGLSSDELDAIRAASLAPDTWQSVLRVAVADAPADQPAVAGRFAVTSTAIEFTPLFPFDPGRTYRVRFDRGLVPQSRGADVTEAVVGLDAPARVPVTRVTGVFPSGEVWPENLLRIYVRFSGPMSRTSSIDHVRLIDGAGQEVVDPFLPMELDLWNQDYTRCTIFLDPGRVKTGIRPNEEMGRALVPGRTYTIEIAADWRDQYGQQLVQPYRQSFTAGPADLGIVTPAEWTIAAPAAGTRDALVVSLEDSLDHGLLHRAVGVARAGETAPVAGDVTVSPGETIWRFVPARPWTVGAYDLVVLSILEDVAGNRVGRLFEVDRFDKIDDHATPERLTRRFEIR